LALSLVIASTSGYFGNEWHTRASGAKRDVAMKKAELVKASESLALVTKELTPDTRAYPLETALSSAMLKVFNDQISFNVSIAGASAGKLGGSATSAAAEMADAVPGTKLQSVKLVLTGSYLEYPKLIEYLNNLTTLPIAVVGLKVSDKTFEATIRVYGVAGASTA
jgi:hypothetical protein